MKRLIRKRKSEMGMSLIETMMTAMTLTVMVIIVTGTVSLSKLMYSESAERSRLEGGYKRTLQMMMRDLRQARKGEDPLSGGSGGAACINNPSNHCYYEITTSPQHWQFSFKVPEKTDQSEDGLSYKTITFEFDENIGKLTRTETSSKGISGAAVIIGHGIENATISTASLADDELRLSLRNTTNDSIVALQFKTTVFFRGPEGE